MQSSVNCFGYFTQNDQPQMRVLILMDSTIPPQLTPAMLLKDVQWVSLPRSSYLQMSGYVDTITKANKGKDTTGRLYPDLVVMMNLFDHLTTTGDYAAMLYPRTTPGTCLLYTSDAADE